MAEIFEPALVHGEKVFLLNLTMKFRIWWKENKGKSFARVVSLAQAQKKLGSIKENERTCGTATAIHRHPPPSTIQTHAHPTNSDKCRLDADIRLKRQFREGLKSTQGKKNGCVPSKNGCVPPKKRKHFKRKKKRLTCELPPRESL